MIGEHKYRRADERTEDDEKKKTTKNEKNETKYSDKLPRD
jgi:hypothetical protein